MVSGPAFDSAHTADVEAGVKLVVVVEAAAVPLVLTVDAMEVKEEETVVGVAQ